MAHGKKAKASNGQGAGCDHDGTDRETAAGVDVPPVAVSRKRAASPGGATASPLPTETLLDSFDVVIDGFLDEAAVAPPDGMDADAWRTKQRVAMRLFLFPKSIARYLASVPLLAPCSGAVGAAGAPPLKMRRRCPSAGGSGARWPLTAQEVVDQQASQLPPFADDSALIEGYERKYIFRMWLVNVQDFNYMSRLHAHLEQHQLSVSEVAMPCLAMVVDVYTAQLDVRRATMAHVPRVLRVASLLKMTELEAEVLIYLLVCHSGSSFVFQTTVPLIPASVARHVRLKPREMLHFLGEHRHHMKQGLITYDAKLRTSMIEGNLVMPQEVVTALSGEDLSEEQLIKLEKTSLATILLEEGQGGPQAKVAPAAVAPSIPSSSGRSQRRAAGGGKRAMDRHIGSTASGRGAGWSGEDGENGSGEDGVGGYNDDDNDNDDDDEEVVENAEEGEEDEQHGDVPEMSPAALDALVQELASTGHPGALDKETLQAMILARLKADDVVASPSSPAVGPTAIPATGVTPQAPADGSCGVISQMKAEGVAAGTAGDVGGEAPSALASSRHPPYESDIEYVDESFKILANIIRVRMAEGEMKDEEDTGFVPKNKLEATMRELKGKIRVASAVHKSRLEATRASGLTWLPRIERLADRLKLSELSKQIMLLLIGNVVSHDILIAINGRYVMRDGQRILTVGYVLFVLCGSLKDRVAARSCFYQSSPLLSNGIISLSLEASTGRTRFNTDLMDYAIDIDRKIVDYLMGTEMETSEMVPGSKLFSSSVPMSNVVLPQTTMELVTSTIKHYSMFEACKKQCGFGEGLGNSSSGLVILFYGPSGTGKTMLASALAHDLKKKLLLVNLVEFNRDVKASDMLRFTFREAKLNDAIIFFDECESFFEARESNPLVTSILAEFETYDGLIIMATNRAQIIDEAMNRRISLMIEFKLPDHVMREKIWREHLPKDLPLAEDVQLPTLALDYELSGGLIRNATLAAINAAVARERTTRPTLQMADLIHGARLQLRGLFQAAGKPIGAASELYVTPKRPLSELIVDQKFRGRLEMIAQSVKSRNTLFSQWGFSEEDCGDHGAPYVFSGPSGTGKSLAAEAIAFECGTTIRLCNVAELLLMRDLEVGHVFTEGRKLGAMIVFDQAQALFDHSERSFQAVQLIQYHAIKYPKPVFILATTGGSSFGSSMSSDSFGSGGGSAGGSIDLRSCRLNAADHILFQLPNRALRRLLWQKSLPEKLPLAADVDLDELSASPISAKLIRAVCFAACCRLAMLPPATEPAQRMLTMKLLKDELEETLMRERQRQPLNTMFA